MNISRILKILCCCFIIFFLSENSIFSQATTPGTDGVSINKGTKFATLTFSLSNRDAENDQSLLINYIDQHKSNWSVNAGAGYVFKNNLGAGLGLLYGRTKEDNTIQASDGTLTANRSFSNKYSVEPFIKNFIPLSSANRFYIINQTELQFSFERSVKESITNDILTRTYTSTNKYGIGLTPGIMVFVVKTFAFETTVDVFGISTSTAKSKTTGLPDSKVTNTDINLKIGLLQLEFGFSYYF